MTEDINRTLGEIKGTLVQFQRDTERRFDELKEGMEAANNRAVQAEKLQTRMMDLVRLIALAVPKYTRMCSLLKSVNAYYSIHKPRLMYIIKHINLSKML